MRELDKEEEIEIEEKRYYLTQVIIDYRLEYITIRVE